MGHCELNFPVLGTARRYRVPSIIFFLGLHDDLSRAGLDHGFISRLAKVFREVPKELGIGTFFHN